ncbi:MAG TPA: nicotinamide riboside transporter PnuC [Gammaproteobacteria bacterium]
MLALELTAVALAVAYLVLAIRQSLWCWPAALASIALYVVITIDARLYMDAALQAYYAAMAVYGWHQWRRGGAAHAGVSITVWPLRLHAAAIAGTLVLTGGFGTWLAANTDAAFPYLDSFTTIGSIVTTYMVARKVLENWIYWLVIDSLYVYIYAARGLVPTAGLFCFYLVLIVIGFRRWLRDFRAQSPAPAALAQG